MYFFFQFRIRILRNKPQRTSKNLKASSALKLALYGPRPNKGIPCLCPRCELHIFRAPSFSNPSSCVWDLLLYYFSKVPQPFHGCWAWVGQVSVRSHRWSEPGAFWQDVVRRLLRGTTQTGCWGAEAPAVHAGTETTYSSAEAVQGDPLSAREIQLLVGCLCQVGWWTVQALSSLANHASNAPLDWS